MVNWLWTIRFHQIHQISHSSTMIPWKRYKQTISHYSTMQRRTTQLPFFLPFLLCHEMKLQLKKSTTTYIIKNFILLQLKNHQMTRNMLNLIAIGEMQSWNSSNTYNRRILAQKYGDWQTTRTNTRGKRQWEKINKMKKKTFTNVDAQPTAAKLFLENHLYQFFCSLLLQPLSQDEQTL